MSKPMQDFWDHALTMRGKTALLRKFDLHPNLATRAFDDLPELVQKLLSKHDVTAIESETDWPSKFGSKQT